MTGQGGHSDGCSVAVDQLCFVCEPEECSDVITLLVRAAPQGSNQISSGTRVCFVSGDSLFSNFAEHGRAVLGHSDCVLMTQLWLCATDQYTHTLPHP